MEKAVGSMAFATTAAQYDGKRRYRVLSGEKHTYYRVTYDCPYDLNESIQTIYDVFYKSLNPFDPESTISGVNRNRETVLDSIFMEAFGKSMEFAEKTKGRFDPTCSPLINLWGFGFEKGKEPSGDLIKEIREYVGYDKIALENGVLIKKDLRVQLNFSAIGDGLSCDIIARYLDSKNVNNYMVDIGGEIVAKGRNQAGLNWSVGIVKPPKTLDGGYSCGFEAIIRADGKAAVATSGSYNNYHTRDGKSFGHTIDPQTGYPVENTILSVTAIASDCVTAEVYATAILVAGMENSGELLVSDDLSGYYIIYLNERGDYGIKRSDSMDKYLG